MAHAAQPFDFNDRDLAAHLLQAISDGTHADLLSVVMKDRAGEEATAKQIIDAFGQLGVNEITSFILAAYPILRAMSVPSGIASQTPANTTDATPVDPVVLFTLADGEAYHVEGFVVVRDPGNPGVLGKFEIGGDFYRDDAGPGSAVMDPIHTINRIGLTTADADIVIVANAPTVRVTGEGGTTLSWDVHLTQVRKYR